MMPKAIAATVVTEGQNSDGEGVETVMAKGGGDNDGKADQDSDDDDDDNDEIIETSITRQKARWRQGNVAAAQAHKFQVSRY